VSAVRLAVPAGPVEGPPRGFLPGAELARVLEDALDGLELGAYDRRTAAWMAGLDTSTVLTVASWVTRARTEGPGR